MNASQLPVLLTAANTPKGTARPGVGASEAALSDPTASSVNFTELIVHRLKGKNAAAPDAGAEATTTDNATLSSVLAQILAHWLPHASAPSRPPTLEPETTGDASASHWPDASWLAALHHSPSPLDPASDPNLPALKKTLERVLATLPSHPAVSADDNVKSLLAHQQSLSANSTTVKKDALVDQLHQVLPQSLSANSVVRESNTDSPDLNALLTSLLEKAKALTEQAKRAHPPVEQTLPAFFNRLTNNPGTMESTIGSSDSAAFIGSLKSMLAALMGEKSARFHAGDAAAQGAFAVTHRKVPVDEAIPLNASPSGTGENVLPEKLLALLRAEPHEASRQPSLLHGSPLFANDRPTETTKLPQDVIHSQLDQPARWASEVAQRIVWHAGQGLSKVELQLTPPHLGKLEVSLQLQGDQLTAQFVAASAAARDALDQALPRLRELLQQSGIQLAQSDVSTQRDFSQRHDGQSAHPQANPAIPAVPRTTAADSATTDRLQPRARTLPAGSIETWA